MPKLWSYQQDVRAYSPDLSVSGVCMVMTYYVIKRMVAGMQITPDLLDRKMGMFMSMQRAAMGDVKLCGAQWVEMLARGDNLQADLVFHSEVLGDAIATAMKSFDEGPAKRAGIYIALMWRQVGHGIALMLEKEPYKASMFDANLGMWEAKTEDDFEAIFGAIMDEYSQATAADAVLIQGSPRDLNFLGED